MERPSPPLSPVNLDSVRLPHGDVDLYRSTVSERVIFLLPEVHFSPADMEAAHAGRPDDIDEDLRALHKCLFEDAHHIERKYKPEYFFSEGPKGAPGPWDPLAKSLRAFNRLDIRKELRALPQPQQGLATLVFLNDGVRARHPALSRSAGDLSFFHLFNTLHYGLNLKFEYVEDFNHYHKRMAVQSAAVRRHNSIRDGFVATLQGGRPASIDSVMRAARQGDAAAKQAYAGFRDQFYAELDHAVRVNMDDAHPGVVNHIQGKPGHAILNYGAAHAIDLAQRLQAQVGHVVLVRYDQAIQDSIRNAELRIAHGHSNLSLINSLLSSSPDIVYTPEFYRRFHRACLPQIP